MTMTSSRNEGAEDQALLAFLAAQRDAVLSIVVGLDEEAWHRSVVPSGWTPAGLVDHLGARSGTGSRGSWPAKTLSRPLGMKTWRLMTRRRHSSVTCPPRRS